MYKYDAIVDTKTSISVSNKNGNDIHTYVKYELPLDFYIRYEKELGEIRELLRLFNSLTRDLIISILYPKMDMYDIYDKVISLYSSINETWNIEELLNNISSLTNIDMECIISDVFGIIKIFEYLYPDREEYLKDLDDRLTAIQDRLYFSDKIINVKDKNEIILPDSWYITKNGTLYNSMGFVYGHKESNLIYPLNDIRDALLSQSRIVDRKQEYLEEYQKIVEDEYVTDIQFWNYLNLCGKVDTLYEDRIYSPLIVNLVKGIVLAHADLYDAFKQFDEVKDKEQGYNELMRLTNESYDDLFVRFLGFSKVNVSGTKAICTSDRYEYKFSEYLDNGHYLDYVNPIEVKDGIIQERDLSDFDTIRRVLKQ